MFSTVLSMLQPSERESALREMIAKGLINENSLKYWEDELSNAKYGIRNINMELVRLKIMLGRMSESIGGETESKKTEGIVERLIVILTNTRGRDFIDYDSIKGRTLLDFGAGVYSPMSVSIVYYANGYSKAVAYEPFPLDIDFVAESVAQTVKWIMMNPAKYNFSGISNSDMKKRLADLDFSNIRGQLEKLERREITRACFGGVDLATSLQDQEELSFDLITSNSVIEHIQDLELEVGRQHRILKNDGICVHTIDYTDHRVTDAGDYVHPFQMYFDGALSGINGLRPSQVESIFEKRGFVGTKINFLSAPAEYVSNGNEIVPMFAKFPVDELLVMVNSYVLEKRER